MKKLLIAIICLSWTFMSLGQTDSTGIDTIPFESPTLIPIEASVSVRFANTATAFLRWQPVENTTDYTLKYKAEHDMTWIEQQVNTNEATLENLPLDQKFVWEVIVNEEYASDIGVVSTFPQEEPIAVSFDMFYKLSDWFVDEEQEIDFCDFIQDMDVNKFEKLAFVQAYSFDNAPFLEGNGSESLLDWYPPVEGGEGICFPEDTEESGCQCKVITMGTNYAAPGRIDKDKAIINPAVSHLQVPNMSAKTWHDQSQAGPAKFISLWQKDSHTDGDYSTSVLNAQASPNYAEILFFLACVLPNGGNDATLPSSCQCERPLTVQYEYNTKLKVHADKRSWFCCDRGAGAQAEDAAWVVARNGKTGDLTPLSAGRAKISRNCASSWNPQFWIGVVGLLSPATQYYLNVVQHKRNPGPINGQTKSFPLPTTNQLSSFVTALQNLIRTPVFNKSGDCGAETKSGTLASGVNTFLLKPNEPIAVTMFSAHYLRVRGFGKWISESAVASDYYLMGVVESQETEDIDCCAEKFASYILGSQKSYPKAGVQLTPAHDLQNRLDRVSVNLASYGSWNGYSINQNNGSLNEITKEFTLLRGPSCTYYNSGSPNDDIFSSVELNTISTNQISLFPSVAKDFTYLKTNLREEVFGNISLFDVTGQKLIILYNGNIKKGENLLKINLPKLIPGLYFVNSQLGNSNYSNKLFIK